MAENKNGRLNIQKMCNRCWEMIGKNRFIVAKGRHYHYDCWWKKDKTSFVEIDCMPVHELELLAQLRGDGEFEDEKDRV